MDRLRRRIPQRVVRVRGERHRTVGCIAGNLLANREQTSEIIVRKPLVVLVLGLPDPLLHLGLRNRTRKTVYVRGDLHTRRIEVGHGLNRPVVPVVVGRRSQPLVRTGAQHLHPAARGKPLRRSNAHLAESIGFGEGVRIIRGQPVVIVVIGHAQVAVRVRDKRVAVVRIAVDGGTPPFTENRSGVQGRLVRRVGTPRGNA